MGELVLPIAYFTVCPITGLTFDEQRQQYRLPSTSGQWLQVVEVSGGEPGDSEERWRDGDARRKGGVAVAQHSREGRDDGTHGVRTAHSRSCTRAGTPSLCR